MVVCVGDIGFRLFSNDIYKLLALFNAFTFRNL